MLIKRTTLLCHSTVERVFTSGTMQLYLRLQFFRNFVARNSESLLGFLTISGGSNFSLRINWKRIAAATAGRALRGMQNFRQMAVTVGGLSRVPGHPCHQPHKRARHH